ncbi:hypothetical protein GUJ93_ZPchr0006g41276 [Zizania palustris]|uniref:Uncharacterized protein n=1 Tax=Zizania palustris TaxID=103762 RepID=A0A8J5VJ18_ZIZPA|nr:hypothetical protein GUJ93_ZPchr0006g41276 [Zizania palustris]
MHVHGPVTCNAKATLDHWRSEADKVLALLSPFVIRSNRIECYYFVHLLYAYIHIRFLRPCIQINVADFFSDLHHIISTPNQNLSAVN